MEAPSSKSAYEKVQSIEDMLADDTAYVTTDRSSNLIGLSFGNGHREKIDIEINGKTASYIVNHCPRLTNYFLCSSFLVMLAVSEEVFEKITFLLAANRYIAECTSVSQFYLAAHLSGLSVRKYFDFYDSYFAGDPDMAAKAFIYLPIKPEHKVATVWLERVRQSIDGKKSIVGARHDYTYIAKKLPSSEDIVPKYRQANAKLLKKIRTEMRDYFRAKYPQSFD